MTYADYAMRARARLKSKGLWNTIAYSCHFMQERIDAFAVDVRFGGKPCHDDVDGAVYCNGRHTMEHSRYHVLRHIFSQVPIYPDDVLVDVGCGEGRVINFWLSQGIRNQIIGIEAVEAVAASARSRYRKYDNVTILHGDAVEIVPRHGTLFFLYNPFSEETVAKFERAVRPLRPRLVYSHNLYMRSFLANDWYVEPIKAEGKVYEFQAALICGVPDAMQRRLETDDAAIRMSPDAASMSYLSRNALLNDSARGPTT